MAALSRAAVWLLLVTYALIALVSHLRAESLQDELRELRLQTCPQRVDRSPGRPWRAPSKAPVQPLFL